MLNYQKLSAISLGCIMSGVISINNRFLLIFFLVIPFYSNSFAASLHIEDSEVRILSNYDSCADGEESADCRQQRDDTFKAIETIVHSSKGKLLNCYEQQLDRDSQTWGVIRASLDIQLDGTVGEVEVIEDSTGAGSFTNCLRSVLKALSFPKFKVERSVLAEYPFYFDNSENSGLSHGSAMIALSAGQAHYGAKLDSSEAFRSYGVLAELGTSNGRHNILLNVQSSEFTQSDLGDADFISIGENVTVGYMSLIYRYCSVGWGQVRSCAGLGWGILKLFQVADPSDTSLSRDLSQGGIPIHLSFAKPLHLQEVESDRSRLIYELSLSVDHLQAEGVDFTNILLGLSVRFKPQNIVIK